MSVDPAGTIRGKRFGGFSEGNVRFVHLSRLGAKLGSRLARAIVPALGQIVVDEDDYFVRWVRCCRVKGVVRISVSRERKVGQPVNMKHTDYASTIRDVQFGGIKRRMAFGRGVVVLGSQVND